MLWTTWKWAAFAAIATLSSETVAFWRMNCYNIMNGRLDPIVNPGVVSPHVHTIQGSSNFGVNDTYESLSTADCTSCEIQDDKSAYWSPQMYYQYANGTFVSVYQGGSVVYYLGRGTNVANMVPFPPGFKMVSGDAAARSYDNTTLTYENVRPIADRVSWACLNTTALPETQNIAYTDCNAGLRAQIHFQSCWDGVNLYKSDNSHVAYMSDIDNGDCPPTHPVQFVHLFMETSYSVNGVAKEAGGRFVLSTGDTTGYSFHADFQNGWNMTTLTAATKQCAYVVNSFGTIPECPPLLPSYILNAAQRCPTKNSTVNETTVGTLSKLPGCINVLSGPARAQPSDMNCPTSVIPPTIQATADSVPVIMSYPQVGLQYGLPNWNYVGCSNDSTNGLRVLSLKTLTTTNMTVEYCQSYCSGFGYKYAGVELSGQCYCDNHMNNNPQFNNGTFTTGQCYWQCYGNKTEWCGGTARIDVYNNTAITEVPALTIQRASGTYGYKGCYIDAGTNRVLKNATSATDLMTPDLCRKSCLGAGYKFFGVEYARECYCGDRLGSSYNQSAATDCNMPCLGNTNTTQSYCGAGSRLALYYSATL